MRTWLSWSSGKDSAWALGLLRDTPGIEVTGLVTTINADADRVAMHAVRQTLLAAQADAAGLPLHVVPLPHPCRNDEYQAAMRTAFAEARAAGVEAMAYGDLFLEDVRRYRESLMEDSGLDALFPLWGLDTRQLARDMIDAGLRARLTCIDPLHMPRHFAGREWDHSLLDALPDHVDPCGENGEFHTFVHAGPMLRQEVPVATGDTIERDGFLFTDLYPADAGRTEGAA